MKFNEILDTFENEDLKELAEEVIKTIPPYFYKVPSSSTGKYHPDYGLGEGGLYRHTIALCRILNYLLTVDPRFDSRERDLLRIAGMVHDTRKSGTQEMFENNKYTNFDHPLQAAKVIEGFMNQDWDNEEIMLISHAVKCHMGQWNVDKKTGEALPVPENKYDIILHTADYLASRKDIEVKFEGFTPEKVERPATSSEWKMPKDYVLKSGNHAGEKLCDLDDGFLEWVVNKEDFGNKAMQKTAKEILEERRTSK